MPPAPTCGAWGKDSITITPTDAAGQSVAVTINGVRQSGRPFTPTGHRIVYVQAGNDATQVAAATIGGQSVNVAIPALLFAGSGSTAYETDVAALLR
jgi:hypothetical protein